MYKKDDVIFVANADSAVMMEHVFKIKDIIDDRFFVTDKAITVFKNPNPAGGGTQIIPGFGLMSTFNRLSEKNDGEIVVDLNNFNIHGIVKDTQLTDRLKEMTTGLILNADTNVSKPIL